MFFQTKHTIALFNLFLLNLLIENTGCISYEEYNSRPLTTEIWCDGVFLGFRCFLRKQKPSQTFTDENIERFEKDYSDILRNPLNETFNFPVEKTIFEILKNVYDNQILVLKAGQNFDKNPTEENFSKYMGELRKIVTNLNLHLDKHVSFSIDFSIKNCIESFKEQFNHPKKLFIHKEMDEDKKKKIVDVINSFHEKRRGRESKKMLISAGVVNGVCLVLIFTVIALGNLSQNQRVVENKN